MRGGGAVGRGGAGRGPEGAACARRGGGPGPGPGPGPGTGPGPQRRLGSALCGLAGRGRNEMLRRGEAACCPSLRKGNS